MLHVVGQLSRALAGCFALSVALPAQAADPLRACGTAHEQAQELRLRGQLAVATDVLRACTRDTCPLEIAQECRALDAEIQRVQPSVVLEAEGEGGAELRNVRVEIDGDTLGVYPDGRSLALDPGDHHFRFVGPDGRQQMVEIVLREGEKQRPVVARFGADAAAEGPPALAIVLGGVGVAALGAFTYFALRGNDQRDELRACQPGCTREGVDVMRERYLLADIALGVSLVSLGTATYLFLRPSSPPAPSPEREAAPVAASAPRGLTVTVGGHY